MVGILLYFLRPVQCAGAPTKLLGQPLEWVLPHLPLLEVWKESRMAGIPPDGAGAAGHSRPLARPPPGSLLMAQLLPGAE